MGEWLVWLILGSLILICFCLYSLSSQVERCVHLAVEIITGNQRRIIAQLDALAEARGAPPLPANVVPFERRTGERRRLRVSDGIDVHDERRKSPGRRHTDFVRTDDSPRPLATDPASQGNTSITHLEAVIDAVVEANHELALRPPTRPWRDTLPEVVEFDSLSPGPRTDHRDHAEHQPGRFVTIGMLDAPERQQQGPAVVDLEQSGGLLVFGTGGSGKTR